MPLFAIQRKPILEFYFRGALVPSRAFCSTSHDRRVKEQCIVYIKNGSFYHQHPSSSTDSGSSRPIVRNLSFELEATNIQDVGKPLRTDGHWAIIGANPTPILDILRGQFICDPPNARTYPYLSSNEIAKKDPHLRIASRAIQYVGFNTGGDGGAASGVRGAYLSARYESRREQTDWTLAQYLKGQTELNPSEELAETVAPEAFAFVVAKLRLGKLLDMPVSSLSNGQTRRSRIAKAILGKPEVLLLDEPFMGLDPPTLTTISPMLKDLSYRSSPLLVLGLRTQDPIPDWITHLAILGRDNSFITSGRTGQVLYNLYAMAEDARKAGSFITDQSNTLAPFKMGWILTPNGVRSFQPVREVYQQMQSSARPAKELTILPEKFADYLTQELQNISSHPEQQPSQMPAAPTSTASKSDAPSTRSEPLIQLSSIILKYGPRTVLGHPPPQPGFPHPGLNLTISRGTRLLLLGPNGSGKTTLLSLLTSDHPQSYSLPIQFFGRNRLPELGKPGLSLWEIQSRIGHSSPEVHAFFPKGQTVRQVLESAWAETFSAKPRLTPERNAMVDHFLRVWKPELCQTPSEAHDNSLDWACDKVTHPAFGRLPFGTQRLLLLLRSIIKQPDIVILDEAFSGLPTTVRDKALGWLEHGDRSLPDFTEGRQVIFPGLTDPQALVVVSHVREEIPDCINEYLRLPSEEEAMDHKKTILTGTSEKGYIKSVEGWNRLWGLK